jgi:hypothetical protein
VEERRKVLQLRHVTQKTKENAKELKSLQQGQGSKMMELRK